MDGGVLGYLTAAVSSGWRKRKGETPTEGFGIFSTVSRLSSRRVCKLVERCCSCTGHSTCSTTAPSTRACECGNPGRQCTGCYCWSQCKNQGRLMTSPTTARGILGHFPRGTDPPKADQSASPPPVLLPTYSSLQAISTSGAGGGCARGGAGRRRSPRYGGGGGRGSGERNKDGQGTPQGTEEEGRGTTEATGTTVTAA